MSEQRYPLSDTKGQWIPTDLLKVTGVYKKAFVTAAYTAEQLPLGTEIIRIRCTQDAWLRLDGSVCVIPVTAAPALVVPFTQFLLKDTTYLIAIPTIAKFSMMRDTVDGDAIIETIEKWNVMSLEHQLTDG